ncbi:1-acyl-sn-glycerol-3-phosphate acyltransferase [Rhodobacteraceae bacterium MCCB 386]|nr:1-acyl-sn-glycerol-3-phosphate acyltransferase [Roseitranquillus sediminis]
MFGGLGLLLVVRLVEWPLYDGRRPVTPSITRTVCRMALRIIGLPRHTIGQPVAQRAVVVANHGSWLDIFALNAGQRLRFVSKSEVGTWPGIGWLARATDTVFIERQARAAPLQRDMISRRIAAGQRLLFFPEGTSTDGMRVLRFRTSLFDALFAPGMPDLVVQPVAIFYRAPPGEDPRFYGWWGGMDFAPHFLRVLAARRQGLVTVAYLEPIRVINHPNRKELARRCEEEVRHALERLREGARESV